MPVIDNKTDYKTPLKNLEYSGPISISHYFAKDTKRYKETQ